MALLGEGAYSAVYKVLRLADREIYALKKVKLPTLSDKEKQNALNEVRLLASVRNDNIIDYKEAFFDEKTRCLCIVTDFADAGDLFQQIVKCQKERTHLREADIWRFLFGMCHGLKALHEMRILHRDLKCANIFLCAHPAGTTAKLGDFNVSKVAKRGLCMTQTGTPYYASPEVWRDMPYDAKSDMWSLGCVLYEMAALRPPFRAEDMEGLYRKVLRGQYQRIPPHYSHDLSEVISLLLQVNPRHRPGVEQLLQMPVMRRHAVMEHPVAIERANDLLSTIKLPKNAIDLSVCLPKPRYEFIAQGEDPTNPAIRQDLRQDLRQEAAARNGSPMLDLPTQDYRRGSASVARLPTAGHPPSLPPDTPVLPRHDHPSHHERQQERDRREREERRDERRDERREERNERREERRDDRHDRRDRDDRRDDRRDRDDRLDELSDLHPAASRRDSGPTANLNLGAGRQHDVVDSLDAYLQQHESPTAPKPPRQLESQRLEPDILREDRNTPDAVSMAGRPPLAGTRGRGEQQLQADYSRSMLRNQYQYEHTEASRASPGPASRAPLPPPSQVQQGPQLYNASQQYRKDREQRRPMANYARPQYELSATPQPLAPTPASQPPKQTPAGTAGGLRLPRIFSKAGT